MKATIPGALAAACNFTLLSALLILVAGCGGSSSLQPTSSPAPGSALRGRIMGGQFPITGSSVQLYAAGSTGYGSGNVALSSPVTTDQNGNFYIAGNAYACPATNPEVYLIAAGGDPGSGSNNPAIALMSALGPCGSIGANGPVVINEVTTIASVWPLAPFMSYGAQVGTISANEQGLATAFANVSILANFANGSSPGTSVPSGVTVPVAEINTMANILASCVNSAGPACNALIANTMTCVVGSVDGSSTPPPVCAGQTTLDSALYMVLHPGSNIAALFALPTPEAPFGPTLSSAPTNWSLGNAIIDDPVPVITGFSPGSLPTGSAAQILTINGSGFLATSTVTFNGVARPATFVSPNQLTIALTTDDFVTPATYPIVVSNPVPGGGTSTAVNFTISLAPTISNLSPASLGAGSATQTLIINGSGFQASSGVTINGTSRAATYVSSGQLTIALTTADLSTVGSYPVVVSNPDGGISNAVNFSVTNTPPTPGISSLSPVSLSVGTAPQVLVINGLGFLASSGVTFNGIGHAPTFVSSSQLTIALTAADLSTVGSYPVVVSNLGGGMSNVVDLSVTYTPPTPVITGLLPASLPAGAAPQALLINGYGFLSSVNGSIGSTIVFDGTSQFPYEFSANRVVLNLTSADLSTPGTHSVQVSNPPNLGGNSNTLSFTVTNNPVTPNQGWAWMGGMGTNDPYPYGVYGTLGVPSASNHPPNLASALTWTDSNGNLWLFGGFSQDSAGTNPFLNALWEYSPSTSEWAWMGGSNNYPSGGGLAGIYGTVRVPAASNFPGSRAEAITWTDQSGNLWLFGGSGSDANGSNGYLNDLWEFSPSANEWTWMGGGSIFDQPGVYGSLGVPASGNLPGGRSSAASWTDKSGNIWLFGGFGEASGNTGGYLNDLWEYSPSTREWTWSGGSNTVPLNVGKAGVYGVLGVPAAGNVPGARNGAANWTDASGNLWLFGGYGYDANDTLGNLNDLWEYNPSTSQWTWVGGGNTANQPGSYGTLGVGAAGNVPGARSDAVFWTDSGGNLWLFGGAGYDSNGNVGYLNDLWEYSPTANQWAWIGGGNTTNQEGVMGSLGVSTAGFIPSSRFEASHWTDGRGNVWFFGGYGYVYNYLPGLLEPLYLYDLWLFQP